MTADITQLRVTEAKAAAARLLLAFRHGNQAAFDDSLPEAMATDEARDLVSALAWIANEAVDKAYRPDVADRVLRHFVRRLPDEPGWVETDEEAAPDVAVLLESVWRGDTETVRELVRATPDTTFVLGKLLHAVALLLPAVPRSEVRRVLSELRGGRPPGPRDRRC
ncbi:hypothetical protein AB0F13_17010 [Streptomyces sp. NPDC026206]|uniref:hypothetical protein n=1 Tax=Streptomyces sp. NPDC026206 TaxID=3157089 RepID=UPI0033C304D2